MHLRYFLTLLVVTIFFTYSQAQPTLAGTTIDKTTGQPVPFVNIQIKGTQRGVISDLQGVFSLSIADEDKLIQFSCVGYQSVTVGVESVVKAGNVYLLAKPVNLQQVTVTPDMNPAVDVMRRVVANAPSHNPDKNFDYKCTLYHKMVFSFVDAQKISPTRSTDNFLLIESVSEKSNKAPSKHSERMITGRVSGFKDPSLAFIPAQIQPFSFYSPHISLLGEEYVNPVSSAGLRNYNFILEDTINSSQGDTTLYISFFPKRGTLAKTLRGSFHIQLPEYVVKTVSASTSAVDAPIVLTISQNYKRHDNGTWFPQQLESRLKLTTPSLKIPVVANGTSYVATVDFNPEFDKKTFSGAEFNADNITSDDDKLSNFRQIPLTASDSMVIALLDSISRRRPLDDIVMMQRDLLKGYIPIGKLNLDYRKLLGYNDYEGFKTGIGLYTNDRMWRNLSIGGYAVYGFGDEAWKYGGVASYKFQNSSSLRVKVADDVAQTGAFSFLAGSDNGTQEFLGSFIPETMDRERLAEGELTLSLARNLDASVGVSYSSVVPKIPYPFIFDDEPYVAPKYTNGELSVKLKWMPGQRQMKNVFGLFRQHSSLPVVWLNLASGRGDEGGSFQYNRAEIRIHQNIRFQQWSITRLRAEVGVIDGSHPDALLYSAMGTRKKIGLEIPYTFATMRPNEFAVSDFQHLFFRHDLYLFNTASGRFKPEIGVTAAAGWSNKSNLYRTYDRGFYEAGVVVDNFFNLLLIKYGFGAHYRLGNYRLANERDNWAFNISIIIAL